ncbi:Flp family type IVb pilin [Pseudaestuariivita sp.]|uniref:Flp family type IVb pilin n=1 Tax=Pseudaestuariivita sp. TaxID=2211669 RepID=UPI0040587C73
MRHTTPNTFLRDESGAVTVDWVVLTAAVVGLAIAAYSSIEESSRGLSTATAKALASESKGFGPQKGELSSSIEEPPPENAPQQQSGS